MGQWNCRALGRSATYKLKRGPNTKPCGTLEVAMNRFDLIPPYWRNCCLANRYELVNWTSLTRKLNVSSFLRRQEWLLLLNASDDVDDIHLAFAVKNFERILGHFQEVDYSGTSFHETLLLTAGIFFLTNKWADVTHLENLAKIRNKGYRSTVFYVTLIIVFKKIDISRRKHPV